MQTVQTRIRRDVSFGHPLFAAKKTNIVKWIEYRILSETLKPLWTAINAALHSLFTMTKNQLSKDWTTHQTIPFLQQFYSTFTVKVKQMFIPRFQPIFSQNTECIALTWVQRTDCTNSTEQKCKLTKLGWGRLTLL